MTNEELMHHGILGMKWGVRRYQNPDGSLTKAGEKRYNKRLAYRDELAAQAQRNHDSAVENSKKAKARYQDLKKNGSDSETYKEWKRKKDAQRAREYESKNSVYVDGERYTKSYAQSWEKRQNDYQDRINANVKVYELMDKNNRNIDRYQKAADSWMKTNTELMNMPISVLTKNREIRRKYREGSNQ